jgi:acyl carrier protein
MNNEIRKFVVKAIEKKSKLPDNCDLDSFNFIDTGYIDSIGVIKFVIDIEAEFDIEIDESDIESSEFRIIGGLISIIQKKISGNT